MRGENIVFAGRPPGGANMHREGNGDRGKLAMIVFLILLAFVLMFFFLSIKETNQEFIPSINMSISLADLQKGSIK